MEQELSSSPLNKAHAAGRRAVRFVRKGRFTEASHLHLKAAGILQELKGTVGQDSLCKCSLEEQVHYHEKQAQLLKVLEEFLKVGHKREKTERTVVRKKIVLQPIMSHAGSVRFSAHSEILKQIDEADSLLQFLGTDKGTTIHIPSSIPEGNIKPVDFTLRPKQDSDVIEELRTLSVNLRQVVDTLLNELNDARDENMVLRRRLAKYESVDEIKTGNRMNCPAGDGNSLDNASSYTASKDLLKEAEALRQSIMSRERIDIPDLAPLEDPAFDLVDDEYIP